MEAQKKKYLDFIKQDLNKELADNPSFDEAFVKEFNYLYYKTHSIDVDIKVAEDKNSVSLTTTSPVMDCTVPELRGINKSYISSKIYLKNGNMYVEYSQGVLIDINELKEKGIKTSAIYESRFETLYSMSCYDKYGFEFSFSSYSDNYPLNKTSNVTDVKEQTLSSFHKPIFSEYCLPQAPIHMLKANVRNVYRREGSYSVLHVNLANIIFGEYKDVSCSLYSTHYLEPKLLRGGDRLAKAIDNNGRYIFVAEQSYAPTVERCYERARIELKEKLEEVKNEYDEKTYNYLLENI